MLLSAISTVFYALPLGWIAFRFQQMVKVVTTNPVLLENIITNPTTNEPIESFSKKECVKLWFFSYMGNFMSIVAVVVSSILYNVEGNKWLWIGHISISISIAIGLLHLLHTFKPWHKVILESIVWISQILIAILYRYTSLVKTETMLLAIPIGFVYVVSLTFIIDMVITLIRYCLKPCKCNIKCCKKLENNACRFFNIDSLITLAAWAGSLYLWNTLEDLPYDRNMLLSAWNLATAIAFMCTCDLSTVLLQLCRCKKIKMLTMREKYYIQTVLSLKQKPITVLQASV